MRLGGSVCCHLVTQGQLLQRLLPCPALSALSSVPYLIPFLPLWSWHHCRHLAEGETTLFFQVRSHLRLYVQCSLYTARLPPLIRTHQEVWAPISAWSPAGGVTCELQPPHFQCERIIISCNTWKSPGVLQTQIISHGKYINALKYKHINNIIHWRFSTMIIIIMASIQFTNVKRVPCLCLALF